MQGSILEKRAKRLKRMPAPLGSAPLSLLLLFELFTHSPYEDGHEVGIELRAGAALYLLQRRFHIQAGAIGPIHRHRRKGVGNGHNAPKQRNLFPFLAIGVALAIPSLMMVGHSIEDVG